MYQPATGETLGFSIQPAQLHLLSDILLACAGGWRVTVLWTLPNGEEATISGVARHVVEPDSCGFAFRWTPESRLRVTSTFDYFIPLGSILYLYTDGTDGK